MFRFSNRLFRRLYDVLRWSSCTALSAYDSTRYHLHARGEESDESLVRGVVPPNPPRFRNDTPNRSCSTQVDTE